MSHKPESAFADDRITSFGLFVEANRRVMRTIEASLQDEHGLALVEFEALIRLARAEEGHMSMSQLAQQMVLTSGGATRLVDRLVGDGLVEREACPSDRRVLWAKLSSAGRSKLEAALTTHLQDLDTNYFAPMSAKDRSTLDSVFDRLRTC